jgi:hypothetical protein
MIFLFMYGYDVVLFNKIDLVNSYDLTSLFLRSSFVVLRFKKMYFCFT